MDAWISGERLHLGAEAEVLSGTWFGKPAVQKIRRKRTWRHPDLDSRLTQKRMTSEVKLTIKLHSVGVPVPAIWDVDFEEAQIIMQHIDGKQLFEILNNGNGDAELLGKVGRSIRYLHRNAVTHGDLSTNNILITPNGEACLIDLGLASMEYELERYGIDLHVLHEILGASHPNIENAMDLVLDGYLALDNEIGPPPKAPGGHISSAEEVVKRLRTIMTRVRYHGG
jgi:Kae1-associated kinase Bud32